MCKYRSVLLAAVAVLLLHAPFAFAEKISVGCIKLASNGPLFIAQERGYFKAEGLDVDFKYFTGAPAIPVAVMSGDVDVGITAPSAAFYNLAGKGGLKIVAAGVREEPGYRLIAYVVSNQAYKAGFTGLDKLAGHSVGVTALGTSLHYAVGKLAQREGVDLAKIKLVQLGSIPNQVSSVTGGQVDMVVVPATVAVMLEQKGNAKILGWMADVAAAQTTAVFTSTRAVTERRPLLERFVRAYAKGAADYHEGLNKVSASGKDKQELLEILSKYTGAPVEELLNGIPYMDPKARLKVRDLFEQVAWFQHIGLVDKSVDPRQIVDLSFVEGHLDVPR